jgi:hypothetical protein
MFAFPHPHDQSRSPLVIVVKCFTWRPMRRAQPEDAARMRMDAIQRSITARLPTGIFLTTTRYTTPR